VACLLSACGGGDDGPGPLGEATATISHYDYRFDIETRGAHARVTAVLDTPGNCITVGLRASASPGAFVVDGKPAAMGTALARSESQTDLCVKAASYGTTALKADGMDVVAVHEAAQQACAQVRAGNGPVFVEFLTYRFRAHSMFDPELYRDKAEVEQWKQSDPIPALAGRLQSRGALTDADTSRWSTEIEAEIEASITAADDAGLEPVEDLTRYVTSPANSAGGPT